MPPNARLWLARASLFADPKGRTAYGPHRYATDLRDTAVNGQAGIDWLLARGLVVHDHDDNGTECWRLVHFDWDRDDVIGGYGRDAGQKRDGLPPQYGRTVDDIVPPPTGKLDFIAPAWADVRDQVLGSDQESS